MTSVLKLSPAVQKYAWGKLGLDSEVAKLFKSNSGQPVDETTPYAELWMGTHKKGPSVITSPQQYNGKPLSEWISENQWALGEEVAKQFNGQFPFLFKVLSISKSLSIQAHPTKEHAKELHALAPDKYPDPNHKPELAIALTDLQAMCGFRPFHEIAQKVEIVSELRSVVGKEACEKMKAAKMSDDVDIQRAALKLCFTALMSCSPEVIETQLDSLIQRISALKEKGQSVDDLEGDLVSRLYGQFPGDVGCFSPYLLNFLHLSPGESIYLAPNEPHAYLYGDCVECMACSDNVVRAGLTPKFKDKNTLCEMLTYNCRTPQENMFAPKQHPDCPHVMVYDPPVPDFTVAKISVPGSASEFSLPIVSGPSLLLTLQGELQLTCMQHSERLLPGSVLCIPAGLKVDIKPLQDVLLYQAYC